MTESSPEQNRPEPIADANKVLLPLLLKHQRGIYAYILVLIPNPSDADDLLQETCLTIYEKFADFEPGTDFQAWANRIAYWKVRQAKQKFARSKVVFDDAVMEAVSHTAVTMQEESSLRHEVLKSCLQKLNERDRRMVMARYEPDGSIDEAAQVSGRTVAAAYKAIGRIRESLHDCIRLNLGEVSEGMGI